MQRRDFATGFLLLQVVIGYEWFASGLTKLVHGDFAGGLSADLHERAKQSAPWYRHFLGSVVTPHASAFGYAIEIAELLSGIVLIAAAAIYLLRGERIGRRISLWLAASTGIAALAGLVLAINFVLANRMGFSPVASDSFDEGISLDALLVAAQIVLLGVAVAQLAHLRTSNIPGAGIGTQKARIQPTQLDH
jgi:hypothetical protein